MSTQPPHACTHSNVSWDGMGCSFFSGPLFSFLWCSEGEDEAREGSRRPSTEAAVCLRLWAWCLPGGGV